MKKTLLIMVMALAVLLTQCRKPSIKFPTPSVTTTVSMTITAGPGSKTDISTMGGIVWNENDKIYVGDGSKYVGCLSIQSGVGNATGTFTGDVTVATGDDCTFHFYYLGSSDYTGSLASGTSTTVDVDFSSQNIYEDNNHKLKNASRQHVGYGKAEHVKVEADKPVMGLEVTMKSKVAIAYFCFQDGERANPYTGTLTLSGEHIYNKMTVKFDASDFDFTPVKDGNISLTNTTTHLKYAMLVPTNSTAEEILNFGGGAEGTTTLENGIEANKFYRIDGSMPIVVKVSLHEYVDLGLPSGLLWATCNLGASKPEDYGDYYRWGGVTPVTSTDINLVWADCPFTNGTFNIDNNKKVFTKYIPTGKPEYWAGEGAPDNKLVLESSDDAAAVAWGNGWRMPTKEDFTELINNTTQTWYDEGNDEFNGVAGCKWVSTKAGYDGKYIFLPATGYRDETSFYLVGSAGGYWSSSLNTNTPYQDRNLYFDSFYFILYDSFRYGGLTVRPVR